MSCVLKFFTYKYVGLDILAGIRTGVVSEIYYWTEFNFVCFFKRPVSMALQKSIYFLPNPGSNLMMALYRNM
jgi:hypothetical protein